MYFWYLALKSLWNRRFTASLTLISVAVSVLLFLGVQTIQKGAQESFGKTVSGTDLIVGARTGSINLLLYSIFHIGNATNQITWKTYQDFATHPDVAWTVPISLGDSHRGYRVMGTSVEFYQYYRYGNQFPLQFESGMAFDGVFDAVVGKEVADTLNYQVGQEIIIAHGAGTQAILTHEDKPFRVIGILARTGTPIDRTVQVSLGAIEAIHIDWKDGAPPPQGHEVPAEQLVNVPLQPKAITAFMLGTTNKFRIFTLQREINNYPEEAIMAILPGATLQEMWRTIGLAENALKIVAGFVILTGLIGMLSALWTSLNERRREMAILRSIGARPWHIFSLLTVEAALLAGLGAVLGLGCLLIGSTLLEPWLFSEFGFSLPQAKLTLTQGLVVGVVTTLGTLIGLLPAYKAYRQSLTDGLSIQL